MVYIQLFMMIFIVVLLIYELFLFRGYRSKKGKKVTEKIPMEVKILESFFKLDIHKLDYERLLHIVAIVSSIDIAIIVTIAGLFENGLIQILIALLLVIPIIFLSYYLIACYYRRKVSEGGKKDE